MYSSSFNPKRAFQVIPTLLLNLTIQNCWRFNPKRAFQVIPTTRVMCADSDQGKFQSQTGFSSHSDPMHIQQVRCYLDVSIPNGLFKSFRPLILARDSGV